jgi:hypothetical protein
VWKALVVTLLLSLDSGSATDRKNWHDGEVVDVVRVGKSYEYRILAGDDRYVARSGTELRVKPGKQVKFAVSGRNIYVIDEDGTTRQLRFLRVGLMPPPPPPPKKP